MGVANLVNRVSGSRCGRARHRPSREIAVKCGRLLRLGRSLALLAWPPLFAACSQIQPFHTATSQHSNPPLPSIA